tara:strand:- start:8271 stop:9782 length:1512 start_codon:yes stop_codon:yes gene_type:complete
MRNCEELLGRARSLYLHRRFREAERLCRQVLIAVPNHPQTLDLLARLAEKRAGLGEDLPAETATPANDPELAAARHAQAAARIQGLRLAALLEDQGAWRDAERVYRGLLQQPSTDPALLLALAENLRRQGRLDAAAACLRRCTDDHPECAAGHLRLAKLLEELQNWEEARDVYQQALDRTQPDAPLLLGLGGALGQLGQHNAALQALAQSCDLAPDWPPALEAYGQALLAEGQAEKAWRLVEKACRAAHASAGLFDLLSQASQALNQGAEVSLAAAFQALQRDPHRVSVYARLAPLLRQVGRDAEAAVLFDFPKLLYWRPQSQAPGYLIQAAFHADLRRLIEAQADLAGALLQPRTAVGRSLELLLEQGVSEYLRRKVGFSGHPYLVKPPAQWRLSARSLILSASSYQQPAIDREGYLSGYYFVQVPAEISGGEGDAGCLRFFDSPDREDRMRFETLRPQEGLLVLFPSYFWTGTIPFVAGQSLIGVAVSVGSVQSPARPDSV